MDGDKKSSRAGLDGLRHDLRVYCVDVPGALPNGALSRLACTLFHTPAIHYDNTDHPRGVVFFFTGNLIGAALSLILFSLTAVSFPLLLDRDDVDFVTAMITSVRAVTTSPVPMIGWALIIVVLLIVSVLPFFLGLLITLPVLGHTTWHLYRRIVVPVVPAARPG